MSFFYFKSLSEILPIDIKVSFNYKNVTEAKELMLWLRVTVKLEKEFQEGGVEPQTKRSSNTERLEARIKNQIYHGPQKAHT